jgi:hypothetical protein
MTKRNEKENDLMVFLFLLQNWREMLFEFQTLWPFWQGIAQS